MKNNITIEAKKNFLQFILKNHKLKRRESAWILNYLMNHEIVLNKTHFVEKVDKTSRGLRIMTEDTRRQEQPFTFYKEGKAFHNPEQAFHDIRLNWHQSLYVEILFPQAWMNSEYLLVLENNPFYHWNETIPLGTKEKADRAMDSFLYESQRNQILKDINSALENDDRESFDYLSERIHELDYKLSHQSSD